MGSTAVDNVWNDAFSDVADDKFHWNTVTDPVTAAAASMHRFGWTSVRPGVIRTKEKVDFNMYETCPMTIKKICTFDVEDMLYTNAADADNRFRAIGPGAIPWIEPLRRLVCDSTKLTWTPAHRSLVRTNLSGNLWTSKGLLDYRGIGDGACYACGLPGTMVHRCFACPAHSDFLRDYGLTEGIPRAAKNDPDNPLWTSALVRDPTRGFPSPGGHAPVWTLLPPSGKQEFTGSAFGDGSAQQLFGVRTQRAGWAVVQMRSLAGGSTALASVVGPLPGPLQDTPAAELFAMIQYVTYLVDRPGCIYHGDCQWVLDGFESGSYYTTRATAVHADLWRRFWRVHSKRNNPIIPFKVKAHVTDSEVSQGYSVNLKTGNDAADVGANQGRRLHPTDEEAVIGSKKIWMLVHVVARYLARANEAALLAADDMPPFSENLIFSRMDKVPTHRTEKDGSRVRCVWCLRTANANPIPGPCHTAAAHVVWRSDDIHVCSRCGAYSTARSSHLKEDCAGRLTKSGAYAIDRMFRKGLHPKDDVRIPRPTMWKICQPIQEVMGILDDIDDKKPGIPDHGDDIGTTMQGIANQFITDEDFANDSWRFWGKKHSKSIEAEEIRDEPAPLDPDREWLPWLGNVSTRRVVRGPLIRQTARIRNNFRFPGDPSRHPSLPSPCMDSFAQLVAAEAADVYEPFGFGDDEEAPRLHVCRACGVRAVEGHLFCTMCGTALDGKRRKVDTEGTTVVPPRILHRLTGKRPQPAEPAEAVVLESVTSSKRRRLNSKQCCPNY